MKIFKIIQDFPIIYIHHSYYFIKILFYLKINQKTNIYAKILQQNFFLSFDIIKKECIYFIFFITSNYENLNENSDTYCNDVKVLLTIQFIIYL